VQYGNAVPCISVNFDELVPDLEPVQFLFNKLAVCAADETRRTYFPAGKMDDSGDV
jgi:hypothetical protein